MKFSKMDTLEINQNLVCVGCLLQKCDKRVQNYDITCEALKAIFQTESLVLCHMCKRIAQHAESFIQSVQTNQLLLENCHSMADDFLQSVTAQPLVNLAHTRLVAIEIEAGKQTDEEEISVHWYGKKCVDIKQEWKEEENEKIEEHNADVFDDADFQNAYVKQEDELSLNQLLKGELELDSIAIDLKTFKKLHKKKKYKHKDRLKNQVKLENDFDTDYNKNIQVINISMKQLMEERESLLLEKSYLDRHYKCKDCIKAYSMKSSYEMHMELHCKDKGPFQCDICKQYMLAEETLQQHKKNHFVRYRCIVCGLTRNCRRTIKDHYAAMHAKNNSLICLFCTKEFNRPMSLRKHINYVHKVQERPVCAYCNKSYANKDVIKQHMVLKHPTEVSCVAQAKRHACAACGKRFRNASLLRAHGASHSAHKDYYCVECDKYVIVYPTEVSCVAQAKRHACAACDKRFRNASLLRAHGASHSAHKDYYCVECDKYVIVYPTEVSCVAQAKRHACAACGKRFRNASLLRAHGASHSAHKDYYCVECDKYVIVYPTEVSCVAQAKRHACAACGKRFRNASLLRAHGASHSAHKDYYCVECDKYVIVYPTEVSCVAQAKRHACAACGKRFRNASLLRAHGASHSAHKDYYCVECDKSFKSESILKHHLRTTSAHTKYLELPLVCDTCGKRFAIRRDLDRHVNRIHLNFKPFECDKCDKAYIDNYLLLQHQRLSHEGYKKPFKYPCKMCNRVFNNNAILKSHLRTHTGERPYQCAACPASFSQSGSLRTHTKLIHLKLTRDGRPKNKV